jgi:hypothetical protein
MSMIDERPGQRDRSPSFPFIPLKTAIERLVAFEEFHKRAPVPPDRIGPAWGMKNNTSQAQQTLAALKAYGLLETRRGDVGRIVALSDDGRTYLRAQQDNIKDGVLRRAALRPKQIETYWRDWGDDRPADAACLDILVLKGGFSQDGAEKFLRVYDATIAFAGLADSDKMETTESEGSGATENGDGDEDDGTQNTAAVEPAQTASTSRPQARVPIMEGERIVFTEEGQPNQYLKLIASGEVDAGLLEALEDFVKRQRKRLGLPAQQIPLRNLKPVMPEPGDEEGQSN